MDPAEEEYRAEMQELYDEMNPPLDEPWYVEEMRQMSQDDEPFDPTT
jgi:hypothetical protein